MAHQYYIKATPTGKGEWKAVGRFRSGNKQGYTAFGLSKQEAINKVMKKMPKDKRFKITRGSTPNNAGTFATVRDCQTGETWTANHSYDEFRALSEVEKNLPKAYFLEKHEGSSMNARNEYALHHVGKTFLLPLSIAIAVIVILFVSMGWVP